MKALPQVVADLVKAREELRGRGWCRGELEDDDGRVCANGALLMAIHGVPVGISFADPASSRIVAANDLLRPVIDPTARELCCGEVVRDWNNSSSRTQADVEAAFDAAASLALDGMACEDLP